MTHVDTQEQVTVRAKYLLGCDGARSLVRKAMAGGGDGDGEWAGAIRMEGAATGKFSFSFRLYTHDLKTLTRWFMG